METKDDQGRLFSFSTNAAIFLFKNNKSPIFAKQSYRGRAILIHFLKIFKTFPLLINNKLHTFIVLFFFSASPVKYIADNMVSYDVLNKNPKDLNTISI